MSEYGDLQRQAQRALERLREQTNYTARLRQAHDAKPTADSRRALERAREVLSSLSDDAKAAREARDKAWERLHGTR